MEENSHIDLDQLVDFAFGRLPVDEALALVEKLETDREASETLDVIAQLMNYFADPENHVPDAPAKE
jgi:hypothetical protein